jgi:hypothetical protein
MEYHFKDFKYLATGDGFNYPVDVAFGTIHLGTLIAEADGYVIRTVDTPNGSQAIKNSPNNKFKTLDIAAEILHRTWKSFRYGGDDGKELVPA